MFASCHLKLGDTETWATDFGLWIAEHRSTESFTGPFKKGSNRGISHSIKPRLWGRGNPPDHCT